jgi:hypothetical protein
MIMEIPQPITCFISKKSEIPSDHAAPRRRALRAGAVPLCAGAGPRAPAPRASQRTVLTVTTRHLVNGVGWAPGLRFPRRREMATLTRPCKRSYDADAAHARCLERHPRPEPQTALPEAG